MIVVALYGFYFTTRTRKELSLYAQQGYLRGWAHLDKNTFMVKDEFLFIYSKLSSPESIIQQRRNATGGEK